MQTHYEVLGLAPFATQMEIRNAFLHLSKQLHPDLNPSDPENHIKFVRLNEAYSILSNNKSRHDYDMRLEHSKRVRATAQSYAAGTSPRPRSHHRSTGQQSEGADWGWDENYETEFDIRKRARNSQTDYKHDAYYGIKGIPRQSNNVVAGACCLLILLGGVYFYLGFKYAVRKQREYLQVDRENLQVLRQVQERARVHGINKQLELLIERTAAKEIGQNVDAAKPES